MKRSGNLNAMSFTLTPELTFLLGAAVFWAILYVLAYVFHLDKHGLDVKPAYFMYKSKALNLFLDRMAHKRRTFWFVLSNIGLAFSIGLMAFGIYLLTNNLLRFIFPTGPLAPVAVYPAIPVITIRLYWLPYFFLAVAVIILSHELAHGVIARLEGISVLSSGVFAFLLFFGAFVEPDEKEFEKTSILARLRMLAAGSSTNLVTAILVILLLTGLFAPSSAGVLIQEVVPNSPADRAGLQQWDVIKAINGTPILIPQNYSDFMSKVEPNTTLVLILLHNTKETTKTITTAASVTNRSRAIIPGILVGSSYHPNMLGLDQYTGIHLFWALFWMHLLGVNVAIFNMLPAFPFDGERILYYPLASLVKKRKRELRLTLNIFAWGLFVLNIALSFLIFGLRPI